MAFKKKGKPAPPAPVKPKHDETLDDKLGSLYAAMDKAVGPGVGRPYGEQVIAAIPRFGSGFIGLDWALCGGYPKGRIIELFGTESGGKTTLALTAAAQVQAAGGRVAFIDAEYSFDAEWAAKLGVNVAALHIVQPDDGESALTIADMMSGSGLFDLVILDSVSALVPKAELAGKMGEAFVGLQARLMSQAMRKMAGRVNKGGGTMLFVNQIREKIGNDFGSPETTSGGRALRFYASVRLDVRRLEQIKQGEERIGDLVRIHVKKNKTGVPFRVAQLPLIYTRGFDTAREAFELGLEFKVLSQAGAAYRWGDRKLGMGKDNAVESLRKEGLAELQADLRERMETGEAA